MQNQSPKYRLFEQFAQVAKALSHPHKLELLELLAQGERSVDALAKVAGLGVANTSRHLQLLRRTGLVTSRKEGLYVFYSLADDDVIDLLRSLRRTGQRHINDVNDVVVGYFNDRDSLEPVSRKQLLRRSKDGLVTVLDVRPSEEYAVGHIPGALNVPLNEIRQYLANLPKEQEIIAYCRGEYCVLAFEAVATLRENGFNARRLEEGYPEWRAAGLPVEEHKQ
ncbi:MAG: metalloregulator ArsR/SmtB family transcription factor [Gammaproteobacteria bacterium]|nr:MAG: metalloregulator ArsR/SmtB family transcription factor [Gammaproteobacteria bacterium]